MRVAYLTRLLTPNLSPPEKRPGRDRSCGVIFAAWQRSARRLSRPFTHCVLIVAAIFFVVLTQPALAVDPQEQLKDPKLEARARKISAGLRCLVCQNQSIDDSDAPLARDLRLIVRQQLEKGASDGQVVDYVAARYGEFVLLKPRLSGHTLLLWLTPVVLVGLGALLAARVVRRKEQEAGPPPLTPQEEKELTSLLSAKD